MTIHTPTADTATVKVELPAELAAQLMAQLNTQDAQPVQVDDPYFVSGEYIELPATLTKPMLKRWHDAKAAYDKAKEELEAAKQAILEAMAYHEVLQSEETGQLLVESRVNEAMVLDTAKLKKAHPEIAAQFQRPRRSRSFRVLV